MITLNTERGLVRVDSWTEVVAIPGFTDGVDYKTQKLEAIIGRYVFADKTRCGLGSCRKKHNRGFVVAIKGGAVTNIGKDCGKTHFGVDFVNMKAAFERDDRNRERRERLVAFQSQIPGLRDRIQALRFQRNGDRIYKAAQTFRSMDCPATVKERLSAMVRARDSRLMLERFETQAEIAAREAMDARPALVDDDDAKPRRYPRRLVSEQVGAIEGLAIFFTELDVRDLLIRDVLPQLKIIEALTVDGLSEPELRAHAKWAGEAEGKLSKAEFAIEEGRKFLRDENLVLFKRLLDSTLEMSQFLTFLRRLDNT